MCNGANLAFTREAFDQVNGYQGFEQVISGDDEFLLYKMGQHFPGQIHFVKDPKVVVDTFPPQSWREFFAQRQRWSGKWKHHRSNTTRGLAVFIFVFHLTWLTTWVLGFAGKIDWWLVATLMVVKTLLEFILVYLVMRLAAKMPAMGWFLGGQFLYSFYAFFMGIAANLGSYNWKNRNYR